MFLYDSLLSLLLLLISPRVLFDYVFRGKYRRSLWGRFGVGLPWISKGERPVFWFHSISVGETRAVRALLTALRQEHADGIFLLSTVTETGQEEAKRLLGDVTDFQFYMPLDFSFLVERALRRLKPDYLILCETDYWYQLLKKAQEKGVKTAVVSAKLSERSARRLGYFPWVARNLFDPLDLFVLQNEEYAERFASLGVPKEKMCVGGNLKLDDEADLEGVEEWRRQLGIHKDDLVLCLGSTHAPEERELLQACRPLLAEFPHLKVLLVPRHPERFDEVWREVKAYPKSARWSSGVQPDHRVILVDTMGRLRDCYALSTVAVVAGSFSSQVGGHNILEPLLFGVPVLFGTHMQAQRELRDLVLRGGAGKQVEELTEAVGQWLRNPQEREAYRVSGKNLMVSIEGSTQRTLEVLKQKILL